MNVGEIQRLLSLKAEKEPDHRFDDLYGLLCNKDWLRLAHDYVAQNAGSVTAGCDGINMKDFDEDLEGNLQRLREELKENRFQPCPVRRVHIPKGNGKLRPLGIPSIVDANNPENLWTLCVETCHPSKTKFDRQMESPVR
jgi:RNA-directed DNA polymerase